jgi:predicted murein hydrolase (TIGR00659 family)
MIREEKGGMKMGAMISSLLFFTLITLSTYVVGVKVFQRYKRAWLNPLYSVTVFIICFICFLHIDISSYTAGNGIFSLLLGTATVSLAIPLYKHLKLIQKHLSVIVWAVVPGTLMGVISVILLTKLWHLNHEMMFSLIPKSVTAPIALSISQTTGGIPSLTILFVVISAVFSLITGPFLLKFTRINSRIAKGLALGTSAQAIGASRAFEWGELEGTMGSIAMISSALFLSLLTPLLINLYFL